MNVEVTEEVLIMNGYKIGNKIMISDSDIVQVMNETTGEYEDVKPIVVTLDKETLQIWIEEYGILEELGIYC